MKEIKEFKEFYEDKELETLNEADLGIMTVASFFGLTAYYALYFGISLIVMPFMKTIGFAFKKGVEIWKKLFLKIGVDFSQKNKVITSSYKQEEVRREIKKNNSLKDKYKKDLEDLYIAIEDKNWDKAKKIFNEKGKFTSKPEVRRLVILLISNSLLEAPVQVKSQTNFCFQSIKKVMGLKTAKFAAYLVEEGLKKKAKDMNLIKEKKEEE
jgi:ABC-type multidrug transport system fused ATPase/permease subunit